MALRMDVWPSTPILISPRVKHLITRFFEISDSPEPTSGKLFADELFTTDGVFTTHKTLIFKGYDGPSHHFLRPHQIEIYPI
jgi:hypothetical protein